MNCAGFRKVLAVGMVIFGLGLCAMPASAGWGCYGGCGGCGYGWGGCGGCGYGWGGCGACGYGWGGLGCGWGGWGYRWGGCGGCGGCGYSCGCDNSCGGTSAAYSNCGCSTCGGGQYISEPAGMPSTPAGAPATPPASTPPTTSPSSGTPGATPPSHTSIESPDGETAVLTVSVPNDAKVTINGMLTKSTGSERRFVSYGLREGRTYKYTVKVEIVREGKILPQEQSVLLTGGAQRSIAFDFSARNNERLAATE